MLPSPASKVTLTRPVGTCPGFAGSGTTTFAFTINLSVSHCAFPFLIVTGLLLLFNVKLALFSGSVLIPYLVNSSSFASSFKPCLSFNVTTSLVKSSLSPSV